MTRFIEELSMSGWPALQTHLYDGWVLRLSNGYTKRANSINLLYPSEIELDHKIKFCEAFYSRYNLPVVFKLTKSNESMLVDSKLSALGYSRIDETSVRTLDLVAFNMYYEKVSLEENHEIIISTELKQEWIDQFIHSSKIKKMNHRETLNKMLRSIIGKPVFVSYCIHGFPVGFGYGVLEGGYVGIYDILVDEAYRGRKIGKILVSELLKSTSDVGAKQAYLQVVIGNTIAENLYNQLGFEELYKYWYRVKL